MGDPKKTRKKYSGPRHPWIKENIEAEKLLLKEYSLKNKKEIYKMASLLKNFKDQAKKLIAAKTPQAEKEKKQLIQSLQKYGLIPAEATLDQILGLDIRNLMDRRLQSLVFKKGLARTHSQARQFIVHKHIVIGDKKVAAPKYLVSLAEEGQIGFAQKSTLINPDHPERFIQPVAQPAARPEAKSETKTEEKKEETPEGQEPSVSQKPNVSEKPKKTRKKAEKKEEKPAEKTEE